MNNEIMALKLNLKRAMSVKGMTQVELSEKTGITQANLSRMISGKASPTNNSLCKIADALGMDITELYDAPDEQIIRCPHCGGEILVVKNNK